MTLTLDIPDPVLRRLQSRCADVPRAVLEGFAVESYRTGTLSRAEIGDLLGHTSRWDTQAFLAEHQAWPVPTLEEVTSDIASLRNTPVP
ncbi:UPF0175 family protein [Lamprocystis purpurea]|jgi:hypothetical protein|uniref:UPF0175 family protein n=1 Tax=Lamprocystis purpurea TaxID=61598 RepID=UPI00036C222D|nr:UPF0175 family protein [Lamprocystis purpurea]